MLSFYYFFISENCFLDSFFLPPKLTSLLALEEREIKSKRGRKVEGYIEGVKEPVFLALLESKDSNQIIYSSHLRSRKEGFCIQFATGNKLSTLTKHLHSDE